MYLYFCIVQNFSVLIKELMEEQQLCVPLQPTFPKAQHPAVEKANLVVAAYEFIKLSDLAPITHNMTVICTILVTCFLLGDGRNPHFLSRGLQLTTTAERLISPASTQRRLLHSGE